MMVAKSIKITNEKRLKLCLVSSTGGHLYQMNQLSLWWSKHERFWITFDRPDTKGYLTKEKIYFGFFPENRNLLNAFRNLFLAICILRKEKPDIIFSTGAGIAPPFFLIGKILGIKLVFLETASYIGIPTLSGRMVHALSDIFLVQHQSSKKFYPKAKIEGALI
jgi:UDP-N-acetylglucosamine:LPS N-acetylglucosamine transferase